MVGKLRWSFALGLFGAAVLATTACLSPSEQETRQPGQSCTVDADCARGLVCSGRRCIPRSGTYSDAIAGGDSCSPGSTRCLDAKRVRICTGGTPEVRTCSGDMICREGACVEQSESCVDEDDDGYGANCSTGPDCDDTDPDVNPGADEECGNRVDDDCDGEVDENCGSTCCPDGCGPESFCHECSCTDYDPSQCQYPYQPCETEGESGSFVCTRLPQAGDDVQPRCFSPCNPDADDPASPCTTQGAECLRLGEDDRGFCVRSCTFDQGCGPSGFGCLPFDGEGDGVCLPADDSNGVGDACETPFDCSSRAICGPFFERRDDQSQCVEACRPFANDTGTDCTEGHCVPLQAELGVCREDADASPGESCEQRFGACGEDATICAPSRQGETTCGRLCRTDRGGEDCPGDECDPVDFFGPNIGVCTN